MKRNSSVRTGQTGRHTWLKKAILLVAALSQFSTVLFGNAAMAQAVSQTIAPTALPTGGTVRAGAAAISQGGTAANPGMTINQSTNRAAIDWNTFNIGSSSAVQFVQPDATSSTLNRVLDTNASQIFGKLSSNGQVFLMNPNGVIFGSSASVDVGGLVATTHSLSNEDYMAGKTTFDRNGATGKIINEGTLTSRLGGYIALLAPEVRNNGVIIARAGTVALAAGDSIALNFSPEASLTSVLATPSSVQALIDNKKIVAAPDGQVIVSAQAYNELADAAINNSGTISAGSIKKSGGKIMLDTSGTLTNSGTIKANSKVADGGTVTLKGKQVKNTGTVSANGGTAGVTNGVVTDASVTGKGGSVTLLGDQVGLFDGSFVSAVGMTGGGTVLVGGDWQGGNGVPQSRQVMVTPNAKIDASALTNGNGGTVVLWSTESTGFYGSIKATGGAQSGDGGKVETSSHSILKAFGAVDASATHGKGGEWLLDPSDVTIVAGSINTNETFATGTFTPNGTGAAVSQIGVNNITSQLNAGTSVTVTTVNASGTGLGDITVSVPIIYTGSTAGVSLTLTATRYVALNADITATNGALNLNINSGMGNAINTGVGTLMGAGNIDLKGGTFSSVTNNSFTDSYYNPYSGVMSNVGRANFSGGGQVTLSGNNTYTGQTYIYGSNLTLKDGGSINSSSKINVAGDLTFNYSTNNNVFLPIISIGTVSVSNLTPATGNIQSYGAGSVILAANNTFSGPINIYAGKIIVTGTNASVSAVNISSGATFQIGNAGSNGSIGASTAISNNGTFSYNNNNTTTLSQSISGTGNITIGDGVDYGNANISTLNLTGANTYSGTTTIYKYAYLQLGNGSTAAGTIANTSQVINGGRLNFMYGNNNVTFSRSIIDGTVSPTDTTLSRGEVAQFGNIGGTAAGILTLSGTNTYSGSTWIQAGTVKAGSAGAFSASSKYSFNTNGTTSGTLDLGTTDQTIGALDNLGNSNGTVALAGRTLTIAGLGNSIGADRTYGGVITGTAASNLIVSGTGTGGFSQILSGNNSGFLGSITVNAGSLKIAAANSVSVSNALTVNGGTFALSGVNDTVASLSGTGGTVSLGSNTLTAGGNNANTTFAGVITGTGGFVKAGTGTMILTGANTYSGTTTINAGATLQIGDGITNGSIASSAVTDNGLLVYNNTNATTWSQVVSGTGGLSVNSGTLTLAGANTYTGTTIVKGTGTLAMGAGGSLASATTVDLQSAAAIWNLADTSQTVAGLTGVGGSSVTLGAGGANTLTVSGTGNTTFAGVISGAGGLTKGGTSILTLSGSNTYTGTTQINGGTLAMGAANALSSSTTVAIGSGTTFNLAGNNQSIRTIGGSGIVALGAGTLTLSPTSSGNYGGVIQGTGNLVLNETSAGNYLALTGVNTLSGSLTVTQGVLILSAANANVTTATTGTNGVLQLGNGASNGSLNSAATISNGGLVDFNQPGAVTSTYAISGTGGVRQRGAGVLTLAGTNSYSGTTSVIGSSKMILGSATALPAASAIALASTAIFDLGGFNPTTASLTGDAGTSVILGANTLTLTTVNGQSTSFAGVMSSSGNGNLVIGNGTATGTQILTGNNTYSGTTTITANATLQIGNNTPSGTLGTGNITANGALVFKRDNTGNYQIDAVISGTGSITQSGTNTVIRGQPMSTTVC